MLKILGTIGILILAVAILVAGYYFGIVMAIAGAFLTFAGAVICGVISLCYILYEAMHTRRRGPPRQ